VGLLLGEEKKRAQLMRKGKRKIESVCRKVGEKRAHERSKEGDVAGR